MTKDEKVQEAVREYGEKKYADGLAEGLQIAERIRGWLTRQPDQQWQKEVREWADKTIVEAKAKWNEQR